MRKLRRTALVLIPFLLIACGVIHYAHWTEPLRAKVLGPRSIQDRVQQYGPAARARLVPFFEQANVAFPPTRLTLVGLKSEKRLELYAPDALEKMRLIRSYPILAASGVAGPKLRRGDKQVPEGIYSIESLNPNSRFHLALRVSYPNSFDRKMAAFDGRTDLGSDIMIHGSDVSVGCLAMGDEAAEDLFVLAADVGIDQVRVILAPADFRSSPAPAVNGVVWAGALYDELEKALRELPEPR